jgi:cytochrome b
MGAESAGEDRSMSARAVRVWDLPTRLFHWLLVIAFAFSWWSAREDHMDWHLRSGLLILALLAFRLVWGLIGGSTARFAGFLRGPRAVWAYVRGAPAKPGHNPLGGWSVVAMLLALCVLVGSGTLAVDTDGIESGPLSYLVSFDTGRLASHVHGLFFNAALALIGLHLAAILFYRAVRGRNLVRPMITGRDPGLGVGAAELAPASLVRFILAAAVAGLFAWWIAAGA